MPVTIDTSISLVTLAETKAFLKKSVSDVVDDYSIKRYINRASQFVITYTRRNIKAADYTEQLNGDGSQYIFPFNYPINSITALYDDPNLEFGSDTEIDIDSVIIGPPSAKEYVYYLNGVFTPGISNIKIVYNAGYSTIPEDLKEAVLEIISFWHQSNINSSFGVVSKSYEPGSVTFSTSKIPDSAAVILDSYKRVMI